MLDTATQWWWKVGASEYLENVLRNQCSYEHPLGLKDASVFKYKYANEDFANWNTARTEGYGYDADLDYLTSWSNTPYGSSTTTRTWGYDAAGNRTSDSGNSGTWTYDNLNRMTASPGMSYASDAVGNRLSRNLGSSSSSAQRLEWDWTNRVKSAGAPSSGARYEYRADGMRTLKIEGLTIAWQYYEEDEKHEKGSGFYDDVWSWNQPTTRYFYDGQMGFEDDYAYQTGSYGSSTSHLDITRYALGARGIDRIEKVVDSTSSSPTTVIQYPLYDAHGNMVATLSKGSGTTYSVGNQRAFEPWGSVFDSSGLSNTPKQAYCASLGHVADSELGLTYMRARYYEPSTGRFISEDPALQDCNWYVYCAGNPVCSVDPDGRYHIVYQSAWAFGQLLGYTFGMGAVIISSLPVSSFTSTAAKLNLVSTFLALSVTCFAIALSGTDSPFEAKLIASVLAGSGALLRLLASCASALVSVGPGLANGMALVAVAACTINTLGIAGALLSLEVDEGRN